jgi:3',5'-cyclic AMP phosphodiesterase CpdA
MLFQSFDLTKLSTRDQHRIAHYLSRRGRLHGQGVFRLFHSSAIDARSLRADISTRDYVGLTRQIQGHWNKDFVFAHVSNPGVVRDLSTMDSEANLKSAIAAINKLRPKFVVITGDLTATNPSDPAHDVQCDSFRKSMARLSDSIPAMYVPGARDVGDAPTADSLDRYRSKFGADFYGAWFGGVRCLVLNSPLMSSPESAPEDAQLQDLWLVEEIEQAKLCATSVAVFSYHPWFHETIDEPDQFEDNGAGHSVRF